jgi:hypothetical protein
MPPYHCANTYPISLAYTLTARLGERRREEMKARGLGEAGGREEGEERDRQGETERGGGEAARRRGGEIKAPGRESESERG